MCPTEKTAGLITILGFPNQLVKEASVNMLITGIASFQPLSLKQCTPTLPTWIKVCPHLT
jgi:hypothetical protein